MATLLILVIFSAFIGLGVPDSLFGAAWPAIYMEMGLPISVGSAVNIISSAGTVLSSLAAARLTKRFGEGAITAFSTALAAAALLGFSLSNSFLWLCALAVPLGLAAGAIDVTLNNYVALHYNASCMNLLHGFYGVGIATSPFLMSLALADNNDWRRGYLWATLLMGTVALITVAALPLWRYIQKKQEAAGEQITPRALSMWQLAKIPAARLTWGCFLFSCGLESLCNNWTTSFLVNSRDMTPEHAASLLTVYFVGFTAGRLLCGALAAVWSSWRILRLGTAVLLCGVALLFLPYVPAAAVGLFVIGMGNGPTYANLTHLVPKNFGADISASVIGSQMAMSYIAFSGIPPLFGIAAQWLGTRCFYWFAAALALGLLYCFTRLRHLMKQQGRYGQ